MVITTTANNDSGVAAQNAGGSNDPVEVQKLGGAGGGGFSGEGGNGN